MLVVVADFFFILLFLTFSHFAVFDFLDYFIFLHGFGGLGHSIIRPSRVEAGRYPPLKIAF